MPEASGYRSSGTLASRMKTFVKTIVIIVGIILLLAVAVFCSYEFYVYPRMKPMLDHDLAHSYTRILSQTELQDLSALSIPLPTTPTAVSHSDIRRLLQRLHDTGHFPEWKPEYKLLDYEGHQLEFTIRRKDSTNPPVIFQGSDRLRSGNFVFSVKASTMSEAIEAP